MKKKAILGWEMIGRLILILILILVVLTIIGMLTGKTQAVWLKVKDILSFKV